MMEKAAADATASSDLVIVTGGASVGEKDFAKTMFEPLGLELIFEKVAIKPGKPVWLGRADGVGYRAAGKPYLGPGHRQTSCWLPLLAG
jgi:molybdopterin biosynthesis enzyme